MPRFITDDILHRYAVVGLFDQIADKLKARYGALVTNVEFSIPVTNERDRERLEAMLQTLREA